MTALAPTLQSFFTQYLIGQRGASDHTITSYRDTLRLLLGYVHERTAIAPCDLDFSVLDAELIGDFLNMLEQRRGNGARTRNARLAAVHSLFSHAALRHPEHAELIARVLAIPRKNRVGCTCLSISAGAAYRLSMARTWRGCSGGCRLSRCFSPTTKCLACGKSGLAVEEERERWPQGWRR